MPLMYHVCCGHALPIEFHYADLFFLGEEWVGGKVSFCGLSEWWLLLKFRTLNSTDLNSNFFGNELPYFSKLR